MFKLTVAFEPSGRLPVRLAPFTICEPNGLPIVGVDHPVEWLSHVGSTEARNAPQVHTHCHIVSRLAFRSIQVKFEHHGVEAVSDRAMKPESPKPPDMDHMSEGYMYRERSFQ
ncbi:hypothetical protein [Alsobacter soli]|nr:hypothetical protein [Alsobacter soli]